MLKRLRIDAPNLLAIACLLAFSTAATCLIQSSPQPNADIKGPVGTENNPLKVASGIMARRLIKHDGPVYPTAEGPYKSGAIVLRATISPEGRVDKLTVISGPESLRRRALESTRQWTYEPFELNGRVVWVQTTITMNIDFGG